MVVVFILFNLGWIGWNENLNGNLKVNVIDFLFKIGNNI